MKTILLPTKSQLNFLIIDGIVYMYVSDKKVQIDDDTAIVHWGDLL